MSTRISDPSAKNQVDFRAVAFPNVARFAADGAYLNAMIVSEG